MLCVCERERGREKEKAGEEGICTTATTATSISKTSTNRRRRGKLLWLHLDVYVDASNVKRQSDGRDDERAVGENITSAGDGFSGFVYTLETTLISSSSSDGKTYSYLCMCLHWMCG